MCYLLQSTECGNFPLPIRQPMSRSRERCSLLCWRPLWKAVRKKRKYMHTSSEEADHCQAMLWPTNCARPKLMTHSARKQMPFPGCRYSHMAEDDEKAEKSHPADEKHLCSYVSSDYACSGINLIRPFSFYHDRHLPLDSFMEWNSVSVRRANPPTVEVYHGSHTPRLVMVVLAHILINISYFPVVKWHSTTSGIASKACHRIERPGSSDKSQYKQHVSYPNLPVDNILRTFQYSTQISWSCM